MSSRKETINQYRESQGHLKEEFPTLANLLDRSLKKKDFWEDRGFDFDIADTSETNKEQSEAPSEHNNANPVDN